MEKLPRPFSKESYAQMHEWFGRRPQIQPHHVQDLLNPQDAVLHRVHEDSEEEEVEVLDLSTDGENLELHEINDNIEDSQRVADDLFPPPSPQAFGGSPIRPNPIRSNSR